MMISSDAPCRDTSTGLHSSTSLRTMSAGRNFATLKGVPRTTAASEAVVHTPPCTPRSHEVILPITSRYNTAFMNTRSAKKTTNAPCWGLGKCQKHNQAARQIYSPCL